MLLVVGAVIRPHGVRGEVVVDVRTDEPERRFAAGSVLLADPADAGPLTVESVRTHTSGGRDRLLVSFGGVADRNAAQALRGVRLLADSADSTPSDDPDEFHDHQLVGLTAVDSESAVLGEVVRVEHSPAADMLVLRRPEGHEALVPFVRAIVPQVDLEAGRIVLTPPDGLFEL
ncbi:MAG: ribosome maturation factor RimM [Micromonosporaceae bacterium]